MTNKPLKGGAPAPVARTHPHPEVIIGKIDHTPTILPDQPKKKKNA
jgi:hypothetical protein